MREQMTWEDLGTAVDDLLWVQRGSAVHLAAEPKLGVFVSAYHARLRLAQTRQNFLGIVADG